MEVQCENCQQHLEIVQVFDIYPPVGRAEGGGHQFFLCVPCWERLVTQPIGQQH